MFLLAAGDLFVVMVILFGVFVVLVILLSCAGDFDLVVLPQVLVCVGDFGWCSCCAGDFAVLCWCFCALVIMLVLWLCW